MVVVAVNRSAGATIVAVAAVAGALVVVPALALVLVPGLVFDLVRAVVLVAARVSVVATATAVSRVGTLHQRPPCTHRGVSSGLASSAVLSCSWR